MSKPLKLFAIALALIFSSLAVYLLVRQHQTVLTATDSKLTAKESVLKSAVADTALVSAASLPLAQQNASTQNGASSMSAGSQRSSIVDAFEKSTSLRTFIENAKRNPAQGGYFMASIAADSCAMYGKRTLAQIDPSMLTARTELVERKAAALKLVQSRCEGYEATGGNDVVSLLKEGAQQGDPIVKLQNDLRNARMDGQIGAEQVRQAFALNNPYAIGVAMSAFQASDESRLLYKGNSVSADDTRYLNLVFQLLPCAFGLDCGSTSIVSTGNCIYLEGSCDMDRFQQIKELGVAPREWERVMQYYTDIEYAYRNGNYSVIAVKPKQIAVVKK